MSTLLQIAGLTEVELLELEEELSESELKRLPDAKSTTVEHGDLGLIVAAVVVTAAVVHGLSVWLAKRQITDVEKSTLRFEKLPDGTVRLSVDQMSRGTLSESPDAKVVEALKTQLSDMLRAN